MPSTKKDRRSSELPVDEERREQEGADRRKSQRILVDLEVDYQCEDTFLFAYITDMSAFGIFIRTNNPEPPGTRLNLRFKLPDEKEPLNLEGEVIWINPYRPGDFNNINPGMGVKFIDLSMEVKERLLDLIRKIAYLSDSKDDEDSEESAEEGKDEDS
jgi:type IV pilus assembly protein PilZ